MGQNVMAMSVPAGWFLGVPQQQQQYSAAMLDWCLSSANLWLAGLEHVG